MISQWLVFSHYAARLLQDETVIQVVFTATRLPRIR